MNENNDGLDKNDWITVEFVDDPQAGLDGPDTKINTAAGAVLAVAGRRPDLPAGVAGVRGSSGAARTWSAISTSLSSAAFRNEQERLRI